MDRAGWLRRPWNNRLVPRASRKLTAAKGSRPHRSGLRSRGVSRGHAPPKFCSDLMLASVSKRQNRAPEPGPALRRPFLLNPSLAEAPGKLTAPSRGSRHRTAKPPNGPPGGRGGGSGGHGDLAKVIPSSRRGGAARPRLLGPFPAPRLGRRSAASASRARPGLL